MQGACKFCFARVPALVASLLCVCVVAHCQPLLQAGTQWFGVLSAGLRPLHPDGFRDDCSTGAAAAVGLAARAFLAFASPVVCSLPNPGYHGGCRSPCPSTPVPAAVVRAIRRAMGRNPRLSIRRLAARVGASRTTVHRVLRLQLGFYPYKLQVVQRLKRVDKAKMLRFCFGWPTRSPDIDAPDF